MISSMVLPIVTVVDIYSSNGIGMSWASTTFKVVSAVLAEWSSQVGLQSGLEPGDASVSR